MTAWPEETVEEIAAADDFHIAPYRPDGRTTGTPTWIWSVVVDGRYLLQGGQSADAYEQALRDIASRAAA